jgi:hypothetical protein
MAASLLLYIDLGDIITKVIAVKKGQSHRYIFPSVVAHRLLSKKAEKTNLLLDDQGTLLRLPDFDPRKYPRTRSYPREEGYLGDVQAVYRPRYAGRIAATLGADREMLGRHPTEDNIDALVHKAFFKSAEGCRKVEIVFVLDVGPKAEAILGYAEASPRSTVFLKWKVLNTQPQLMQLSASSQVVDAADCAVAALPPEFSLERVGRLLLIDIGYLRTKLTIMSTEGCEYQEQLHDLGVSDCVRRILLEGQELGLIEDEYSVIRALERSQSSIEVAGRRFDVSGTIESAKQGLEEELARAAQGAIAKEFGRRGDSCQAVAIIGGGAAIAGQGLATRLKASDLGLDAIWIATDTKFFLLEGAQNSEGIDR